MDETVNALGVANSNIAAALAALDSEVAKLRGAWTGAASDAYDRAHAEWVSAIDAMNQVLDHTRSTTAQITDRHRAAEKDVTGIWG